MDRLKLIASKARVPLKRIQRWSKSAHPYEISRISREPENVVREYFRQLKCY